LIARRWLEKVGDSYALGGTAGLRVKMAIAAWSIAAIQECSQWAAGSGHGG